MKISVGICTHNGEKFIAEQLNSIVTQSIKPDEIILTDDNSQDRTVEIARSILEASGISYQVIAYDTHQGILRNFSNCFSKCTGDVIFSCDQDDIWMHEKIESFLPHLQRGCNFVYSNAHIVDAQRNTLSTSFWAHYGIDFSSLSREDFSNLLLTSTCIAGCNMAFTKELYDKTSPIPYHFLHDGWLAICAPLFGEIAFIDKPLIEYRVHGNNTSGFRAEAVQNNQTHARCPVSLFSRASTILESYRELQPDQWFGNHHNYVCNQLFQDRMSAYFSPEYAQRVQKSIHFHKAMLECLPKHRVKSILILIKEYFNGNYKLFRGGNKRFAKDILFLLVNKHSAFCHNDQAW